jgi:hypothetical protein
VSDSKRREKPLEQPNNPLHLLPKGSNGWAYEADLGPFIYGERQVNSDLEIHFHIRLGRVQESNCTDLCLTIDGGHGDLHGHVPSVSLEAEGLGRASDNMQHSMLIHVAEFIENPKQALVGIRHMVRLKSINDCACRSRDIVQLFSPPGYVPVSGVADGKAGQLRVRPGFGDQRELPNQVIEGESQVIHALARKDLDEQEPSLDIANRRSENILDSLLTVELGRDLIRITTKKCRDLSIQNLQVINGPANFRAYVEKWVHGE